MAPNPREILWSHTGELWDGWNGAPGTGALECGTGGKSRGGDLGKSGTTESSVYQMLSTGKFSTTKFILSPTKR